MFFLLIFIIFVHIGHFYMENAPALSHQGISV